MKSRHVAEFSQTSARGAQIMLKKSILLLTWLLLAVLGSILAQLMPSRGAPASTANLTGQSSR